MKNTLNGFLRPSLAELILKYADKNTLFSSEPLVTWANDFEFIPLTEEKEREVVNLVDNLCFTYAIFFTGASYSTFLLSNGNVI